MKKLLYLFFVTLTVATASIHTADTHDQKGIITPAEAHKNFLKYTCIAATGTALISGIVWLATKKPTTQQALTAINRDLASTIIATTLKDGIQAYHHNAPYLKIARPTLKDLSLASFFASAALVLVSGIEYLKN